MRKFLVGPSGLEPPTSCLSGTRSNLLSYDPSWLVKWLFHLGKPSLSRSENFICIADFILTRSGFHFCEAKISLQALACLVEMMGFGRGANCAPWSPSALTVHRTVIHYLLCSNPKDSSFKGTLSRIPYLMVEMMGFEPMTPCLQGRCSPN